MKIKDKVKYCADGCLTFIESLMRSHHVDEADLYEYLSAVLTAKLNRLRALDPYRNK